jgi:hypothetical protein
VAKPHHLGDAASVISVGLDRARRQEALGMARLDAHRGDARLAQPLVQPFRQRTGLDAGKINDAGPFRKTRNERSWLTQHLALPQYRALAVHNAHRRLGQRHVEPGKYTHNRLLVNRLIRLDSKVVESGSDYPSSTRRGSRISRRVTSSKSIAPPATTSRC